MMWSTMMILAYFTSTRWILQGSVYIAQIYKLALLWIVNCKPAKALDEFFKTSFRTNLSPSVKQNFTSKYIQHWNTIGSAIFSTVDKNDENIFPMPENVQVGKSTKNNLYKFLYKELSINCKHEVGGYKTLPHFVIKFYHKILKIPTWMLPEKNAR